MPAKKTKPKSDRKKQSERFIKTARALGVDETGQDFDRALAKIAAPKSVPKKPTGKKTNKKA